MENENLYVIADDLGLHTYINDGIIFLLKEGKINGASLMPNGEAFEDAVKKLKQVSSVKIGIHLNLVEQKSLISGRLMPKNHRLFFVKYLFGFIRGKYIQEELEAQIDKIIQADIKPAFLNSNQHLHLLLGIMARVIGLAKKYNIPYIRIVNEPVSLRKGKFFRQAQLLFLNFLSQLAKNKIKKAGLECNDYFIGFINAGVLSKKDIKEAKKLSGKCPSKIIELGCHPGYENNDLRIKYKHWGNYNWQKELNFLK